MKRTCIAGRFHGYLIAAALAVALTGCNLDRQGAPSVTGPSEFALSLAITATPDHLPRDGSSQSVVTITARDAGGNAVAGRQLSLAVAPTAAVLSQTTVTTDTAGNASFAVTAPPSTTLGNSILIEATPVGTDVQSGRSQTVAIALTGASNQTEPTPDFTFDPAEPQVSQIVTFDASSTTDEGGPCLDACTYTWHFDDGSADAAGRRTTHTYTAAGSYTVTLDATDASGVGVSLRKTVVVSAVAAPAVTIAVAPTSPVVGQAATFTATAVAGTNHSISSYTWQWGDGTSNTTTSNPTVNKTFSASGTRVVTVTATDDLGQTGSATLSVTVSSGISATFTISPTDPSSGNVVHFDASSSTISNGSTISSYAWTFGDGNTGTGVTATNTYTTAATYVVRLTITDAAGRTATTTQNVTVK